MVAADALYLNMPLIGTKPAIFDQQFYQPRARLDLHAKQLVEFGSFVHVSAANTLALIDLERFAVELEKIATTATAFSPAICSLDQLVDVTRTQGSEIWSSQTLAAAVHLGGDDYDVAEAEEANLQASRIYGW